MDWNEISDGLPEEGAMVYATLVNSRTVLCIFRDDSFGLHDDDINVIKWAYLAPYRYKSKGFPRYNPQSTSRIVDHKDVCSLTLSRSLDT